MNFLQLRRHPGIYIILALWLSAGSCSEKIRPVATPTTNAVAPSARLEEDILSFVNEYRAGKGLPVLQMQEPISIQAQIHSVDMAKGKTPFGHEGFENRVKIITQQVGFLSASAENVAYGNLTARQVVDGWLKSPGHRKNIEGNFTLTGIGTAQGNDGVLYFTQIFGRK